MPARTAKDETEFARNARLEAEQEGIAKRSAEEDRVAQQEARVKSEAARDKYDAAFKALDARATARWATAEFAQARDAGGHAAQRFAVGDYLSAAEHWDDASAKARDTREGAAAGAGRRRAARPGGVGGGEDGRGA